MSTNKIVFTQEQLDYLESVFPESTNTLDTNTMLHNNGKRTVVLHIKYLIDQSKQRIKKEFST